MAYKGVLDDVRKTIALGNPERLAVLGLSEEFDTSFANLNYEEYATDGAKMAKCRSDAVEAFDYDWVCLGVDDLNVPAAAYHIAHLF